MRTVESEIPSRPAIAVFEPASARANTIRQRNAKGCHLVARRAYCSNVWRSSTDNTISTTSVPAGC